jgi:hypothetical protein
LLQLTRNLPLSVSKTQMLRFHINLLLVLFRTNVSVSDSTHKTNTLLKVAEMVQSRFSTSLPENKPINLTQIWRIQCLVLKSDGDQ